MFNAPMGLPNLDPQNAIAFSTSAAVNRDPSAKPHSRAICFSFIRKDRREVVARGLADTEHAACEQPNEAARNA
jgi:hypothetical protein